MIVPSAIVGRTNPPKLRDGKHLSQGPGPLKLGWYWHHCLGSGCPAPPAPARDMLPFPPPSTHSSMPTSFSFFRLSPSPPYTATRLGMKFSSVVSTVSRSFLQREARNEEKVTVPEHPLPLPLIAGSHLLSSTRS